MTQLCIYIRFQKKYIYKLLAALETNLDDEDDEEGYSNSEGDDVENEGNGDDVDQMKEDEDWEPSDDDDDYGRKTSRKRKSKKRA